jgi:hypothetical protein
MSKDRELLVKVLAYYEGRSPYDFWRLDPYDRDNLAHDAWAEILFEIREALKEEST